MFSITGRNMQKRVCFRHIVQRLQQGMQAETGVRQLRDYNKRVRKFNQKKSGDCKRQGQVRKNDRNQRIRRNDK